MPGVRRGGRILALQSLYEMDVSGHDPLEVLKSHLQDRQKTERAAAFAEALVKGVLAHRDVLDKLIERYAPAWPVEQLPPIERNVLRLAIYEVMMAHDTPPRAAINEAVELAKAFGSESGPRFVNGVLGSIMDKEVLAPENTGALANLERSHSSV